jgi:hypothetical protein
VAQAAEDADPVVIQAVVVGNDGVYDTEAVEAFHRLADLTKGSFFEAADASLVPQVLQETIADIETPKSAAFSNVGILVGGGLCLTFFAVGAMVVVLIIVLGKRSGSGGPAFISAPPPQPGQRQFADAAILSLLRGQAHPSWYPLTQPVIHLGRARQGNDIVISDPGTSNHHAEIRWQAGTYAIQDLRSTNGTFVNGKRIVQPQQLRSGDRITIGSTEWLYQQT